ncbi:MAG: xylulokinase [Verrucomicrobiota bacterium]
MEDKGMIYLGIDSGTQSTKCIAWDGESGVMLAEASAKYGLIEGLPEGHLEQEPSSWIEATERTVTSCLEQLGDRKGEVRGIGVSGQQHGLVVLDEADEVIRPAKLWCDTSTQSQCDAFAEEFGGTAGLIEKAGNAMLTGYTAPKILWLKEEEPAHFAQIRTVLLPHDYLNFWLTGVKRMEYGDASGTGLMNVRTRQWDPDLVSFIDPQLSEMLPPLGSSCEVHGTLKPDLARKWGVSEEVIVSAGGGDNMMGAIGTGNIQPGTITASLGTSGTLYGVAGNAVVDREGEVAGFCDSTDQWLPLVCTMNVTATTEKVRELFGMDLDAMEKAVASADPGAGGILLLPYLHGERTPNLPDGCGVWHGLKPGNLSPENLVRASMEGATLGLAYGLQRFRELGMEPSEIRLTGGGSKSAAWRQICADAFGVPVVALATAEGAVLGSAIQAAAAWEHSQGQTFSVSPWCEKGVKVDADSRAEPTPEAMAHYEELRERFRGLTNCLGEKGFL